MDQLQLKDFLRYRFLSSPKFAPGGARAAFVVTSCREEEFLCVFPLALGGWPLAAAHRLGERIPIHLGG